MNISRLRWNENKSKKKSDEGTGVLNEVPDLIKGRKREKKK